MQALIDTRRTDRLAERISEGISRPRFDCGADVLLSTLIAPSTSTKACSRDRFLGHGA